VASAVVAAGKPRGGSYRIEQVAKRPALRAVRGCLLCWGLQRARRWPPNVGLSGSVDVARSIG